MDDLAEKLDLKQVMDRNVENLSGGELQRFAIAMCAAGKADVYMIDEPSSYLDVRQRLKAAQVSSLEPTLLHHCLHMRQPCCGSKAGSFFTACRHAVSNVLLRLVSCSTCVAVPRLCHAVHLCTVLLAGSIEQDGIASGCFPWRRLGAPSHRGLE